MNKYGVSTEGLQEIFRKLVDANAITPKDLRQRTLSEHASLNLDQDALMLVSQETSSCLISVYDIENPVLWGAVCEIGFNALTTSGIGVMAGQVKISVSF